MGQKVKKQDRLSVYVTIKCPDLNRRASYEASNRKMRLFINGVEKGLMESGNATTLKLRIRDVITAEKVFIREDGSEELDFRQKFIVGQNFVECIFNSGKVRRKPVSFKETNTLELIQQQDFWK